jgi:hypothetical protein
MTKPKQNDLDDVGRQKLQPMVADPSIAAKMNGPASLSAESATPLGKPSFLSTAEYDLGRKILKGEASAVPGEHFGGSGAPDSVRSAPGMPRPLTPARIDKSELPSASLPTDSAPTATPNHGVAQNEPPMRSQRGLIIAALLLFVALAGYGIWYAVVALEPTQDDDGSVSVPPPRGTVRAADTEVLPDPTVVPLPPTTTEVTPPPPTAETGRAPIPRPPETTSPQPSVKPPTSSGSSSEEWWKP